MELNLKFLAAAFLIVGVLPACGNGSTSQPSNTTLDIDPTPVMRQAVGQLLALESASFSLDHLEGSTILVPGVLMTRIYGEVSIPGRFSVTVEAESEFPKSYLEINIITVDDAAYMTDIFTGRWNQISADSLPFNLSGLGQTLADIVDAVESPVAVGEERLRGVGTFHIKAGEDFPVGLELWLGWEQGLLQQVRIIGRVVPTDDADTVRQLSLEDINQPVEISPPGIPSG